MRVFSTLMSWSNENKSCMRVNERCPSDPYSIGMMGYNITSSFLISVYPVITTRILNENDSILAPSIDDDPVISVYQFTDFFLIDNR